MYQSLVLDDVPTEIVPGIPTTLTFVRRPEALSNIPLANVYGCRTVIQDVNALPAFATPCMSRAE
jgi:hypothetical protein